MSAQESRPVAGVLREKHANMIATAGAKTPNGQQLKTSRQGIKQTPQNDAKPKDENLTQSAKNRALLSRLKATNAAISQASHNSQALTSHQLAHQTLAAFQNTPKRQIIPSASNNDSAKLDKDAKKPAAVVAAKPSSLAASLFKATEQKSTFGTPTFSTNGKSGVAPAKPTTSFLTPTFRPSIAASKYGSAVSSSAAVSSNSSRMESSDVNPVWNGVDYSHMIAQKAQLGYTGPGYIVEYDCNEKYLRGLLIKKGLWKVTTSESKPRDSSLAYLGPPIFLSRVDVDDKNTPSKVANLTKFDFNWKQRFNTVAKSCDIASSNSTTHSLNLETNHQKVKKQIRWAIDPLESITENTSSASASSPALTPAAHGTALDCSREPPVALMPSLDTPVATQGRKSLRRSFSLGDMNEYLVDDYECTYAAVACARVSHLSPLNDQSIERHDATFDLERPQYAIGSIDVTKSSPCCPQEPAAPIELHESHIKCSRNSLTPTVTHESKTGRTSPANKNETYTKSAESSLVLPAVMVRSTSAASVESIGYAKSNESSSHILGSEHADSKELHNESSKHSLSLLNEDSNSSMTTATAATATKSSPRLQASSSAHSSANMSLELTGLSATERDHLLVNELAGVSEAVQELTSKLAKTAYFADLMPEVIVSTNSASLKSKFKTIKAESSIEFVRFFNQLDLAAKLIDICKANLKLA